jgi:hypothetical protein
MESDEDRIALCCSLEFLLDVDLVLVIILTNRIIKMIRGNRRCRSYIQPSVYLGRDRNRISSHISGCVQIANCTDVQSVAIGSELLYLDALLT